MPYDFATPEAETRCNEFMADRGRMWRLTDEELRLAEHLCTAPALRPFADALDAEARMLNVDRVRPLGRPEPVSSTQHLMLMVLLSLVTVPHITAPSGATTRS